MKKHAHSSGFTLVEIVVVMTIMVILAGLVVGSMSYVRGRQDREKAKAQIALLAKAIEEYKTDMGEYPGDENANASEQDSKDLYQALFKDGYDYTNPDNPPTGTWDKARKIYLTQLDPQANKQGWVDKVAVGAAIPDELAIVDPWGKYYRYRRGTSARNPDFDLWSAGKDGKTNLTDMKHADNRDDIW